MGELQDFLVDKAASAPNKAQNAPSPKQHCNNARAWMGNQGTNDTAEQRIRRAGTATHSTPLREQDDNDSESITVSTMFDRASVVGNDCLESGKLESACVF
jgi:hypothetical protein